MAYRKLLWGPNTDFPYKNIKMWRCAAVSRRPMSRPLTLCKCVQELPSQAWHHLQQALCGRRSLSWLDIVSASSQASRIFDRVQDGVPIFNRNFCEKDGICTVTKSFLGRIWVVPEISAAGCTLQRNWPRHVADTRRGSERPLDHQPEKNASVEVSPWEISIRLRRTSV